MGTSNSRKLEPPRLKNAEINEFSRQSLFSPQLIERLYGHYYRIASSQNDDGVIDLNEFCLIIHKNPNRSFILEGIFNLFDANRDGVINFREFLQGLSIFNKIDSLGNNIEHSPMITAAKTKEQIDFSLRLLDLGRRRKIYVSDIQRHLVSAVKENPSLRLNDKAIEAIVERTFDDEDYEKDESGKYLTCESYTKMVLRKPIIFKWLAADMERMMQDSSKKTPKRSKSRCLSV